MKISLNWINDYLKINLPAAELEEILTAIGLEVEGMEETKSGPDLQGVVIGEVLTCESHPDADRLRVTTVNVGKDEPIQIVCGAPNVAQGQKVLVATVGTILPTEDDSVFKIKKGKIRGQVSEGMICAEDELGVGNAHDGILVLDEKESVGTSAEDYFQFERDVIYDIGLTPNRSDATSHLGVAKDLWAYMKVNKKDVASAQKLHRPDVSSFQQGSGQPIEVEIKDTVACPRYSGILLENVTIQPSPEWMQNRLRSIGVRPISNIVDITNFILHELGQPLHAFDADKIAGNRVIVEQLPQDTSFITLDEKEIKLHEDDLMICDGNDQGMCIAGVFGGVHSGVKDGTSRIFLESAHFAAGSLRRTSFRHLLRTDAAMVFEKGSDPNNTVYALQRAVLLMQEYANASVASELIDIYPSPIAEKQITVTFDRIKHLIGGSITATEIVEILEAMEMTILSNDGETITIAVPTDKADVTRDVDIVEEVLRIYGFNKVALPGYMRAAIQNSPPVDPFKIKNTIANMLNGAGFSEMMGLSLVDTKYIAENRKDVVTINNTSNITLNVMRPSMVYTALETVAHNQNRQQNNLRLFENGRSYEKLAEGFTERDHLALILVGDHQSESWTTTAQRDANFYDLKSYVNMVLSKLGMQGYQVTEIQDNAYFEMGLRYHRGPNTLVEFGTINHALQEQYGVKKTVFHAIFQWDVLFRFMAKSSISVQEITKYPVMRRDLALVIDDSVKFSEIVAIAQKTDKKLLKNINLFDVYSNEEQLGKGKTSYAVSYHFEHMERTLKEKEVTKIMDAMIRKYESDLGAVIRK